MLKYLKNKYIILTVVLVGILSVLLWAFRYYNEEVAYFEGKKYQIASKTEYEIILSKFNHNITVQLHEKNRTVIINNLNYDIRWIDNINSPYVVTYPSGQEFKVVDLASHALTMDGEFYFPPPIVEANNGVVVPVDQNQDHYSLPYYPTELVKVAYERYYEKQGIWQGFVMSFLVACFGVALFFSRELQLFLFMLSHRLDVVDPEPTDFYYMSTKIGALASVVFAIVVFGWSL